jgi:hypothetical protein
MKYLGEKSLSSFLHGFLRIGWYIVLIVAVLMGVIGSYLFFTPIDDPLVVKVAASMQADIHDKDWVTFKHLPVFVRLLIVPYFIAVVAFLLKVLRMAQHLFANFTKSIVFDKGNVTTIAALGKTLIPFSILTFNFSCFFTALLLLLLCEIFKNGTFLQEEHDLTV